mmetsp:Transcript_10819/g.43803  ORF Transcript_10819/g.43803 Transcript_10819/m.43803 type:complete len:397 (-) Transcript_10819:67-1257(-)
MPASPPQGGERSVAAAEASTTTKPVVPPADPPSESSQFWWISPVHVTHGAELGRGSYGIVREGKWRHSPVAIKILYQDAQAQDRELFEREVRIMATLHHPNIVQFFGFTRSPELSLVIEYFPEGSVEQFVRTQKPGPKTCLSFCTDMALAIEYLHSRTPSIVIHRDIKPANFLLTGSHRVKLGDFGIARARIRSREGIPVSGSSCSLADHDDDSDVRITGTTSAGPETEVADEFTSNCGTARFMAPELWATDGAKTRKYSTKADVFSLGLVYYFVWERVLPSIDGHRTPALHLEALLAGKRPVFHRTPKPMKDLVQSMWKLDPEDRPYAHATLDFLQRLRCKSPLISTPSSSLVVVGPGGASGSGSADSAGSDKAVAAGDKPFSVTAERRRPTYES